MKIWETLPSSTMVAVRQAYRNLVNPVRAFRRLVSQARELRLDEAEYTRHGGNLESAAEECESGSALPRWGTEGQRSVDFDKEGSAWINRQTKILGN
jgi:hypothetical protein